MKRVLLALALAAGTSGAQSDTATVSYMVCGVRVIQRKTTASIVVANLYLLGGVAQMTPTTPRPLSPAGQARRLAWIPPPELSAYTGEQRVTSRRLRVIGGNVSRAKREALVSTPSGSFPAGKYVWTMPDTMPTRPADVIFDQ